MGCVYAQDVTDADLAAPVVVTIGDGTVRLIGCETHVRAVRVALQFADQVLRELESS